MFGFGKKKATVVLVIPPKQYDEDELHILEKTFKHNHIKQILASTSIIGHIFGMKNGKVKPDIKYTDIQLEQCDGLVFVGGLGSRDIQNDYNIHTLIKKAAKMNKILGAIDYAPLILAHAEVLNGKRATVLETEEHKLQTAGVIYTAAAVEIDGNFVTASHPSHAQEFAEVLSKMLHGETVVPEELETK